MGVEVKVFHPRPSVESIPNEGNTRSPGRPAKSVGHRLGGMRNAEDQLIGATCRRARVTGRREEKARQAVSWIVGGCLWIVGCWMLGMLPAAGMGLGAGLGLPGWPRHLRDAPAAGRAISAP